MKNTLFILLFFTGRLVAQNLETVSRVGTQKIAAQTTQLIFNKDSITFYGDSWVLGTGTTGNAYRWTTLLCNYLNAIEDNRGVSGTTLEKKTPYNYGGSPNMSDNKTTIPTKRPSTKLLVISYGQNDIGRTDGQYTPDNFKLTYDSIIDYAINTKGWNARNILIISPSWIPTAGLNFYGTNYSITPPTRLRADSFVAATKASTLKWGTLYCDIYNGFLQNGDTTAALFVPANNAHLTDSGHAIIASLVLQYMGNTGNNVQRINFTQTGRNRDFMVYGNSGADSLVSVTIYPKTGVNVGNQLSIVPRGTGLNTALRTSLAMYGTDALADGSNYNSFFLRTTSTGYGFQSIKAGTGTLQPQWFDATGSGTAAASNLFLATAGNVGIGTGSTVSGKLNILSTTEQLRTAYDVSNYYSTTVASTGGVTFNAVGSGSAFTFSDPVTVNGIFTVGLANKIAITEGTDGRSGQTTLVSGTKAITITGLTTSSRAIVTFVSAGGTVTTTWQYAAVCTSNTLTITAITTAGATNTTDTSVLNYLIIN